MRAIEQGLAASVTPATALFFLLLVVSASAQVAVPLQATRNTRDLGGIPVAGGRVRPAMVYRSGALCFLTPADVEKVGGLKLRTIVDLRNEKEIARDGPDRVGNVTSWPMRNSQGIGQEAYYYLVRENRPVFKDLFGLFARRDSYPILFHCSAGKDRTGIVTALLLESLGASRDAILDDYLQSVRNSPKLVVKPEWLQEVFAVVDAAGGIEPYLAGLGVTPEQLQSIREILIARDFSDGF